MRLLVDVYAADGTTRLGEGPLAHCLNAIAKRALDGAGSFTLNFSATDGQARELLQAERRVILRSDEWTAQGEELRELARGVVRQRQVVVNETDATFTVDGPDALDALTRRTVRLNRAYTNQTLSAIATDLIGLVPGWSVVFEGESGAVLVSARFAGTTVLKCLLRLAEENGLHLREHATAQNTVEIGVFGTQTTITLSNSESVTRDVHSNRDLILIDRLTEGETSREVVNRIIPLGAGEGQAALTLRDSTRTSPYTIQSVTETDGSVVKYLDDEVSQDDYEVIEKVVTFKEIAPVANTAATRVAAANALYDAAAEWLRRNSRLQTTYKVSGVKAQQRVQVGDQIRIIYKGEVFRDNLVVDTLEVDAWFWILEVGERVADSGATIDLTVSIVDRMPKTAKELIVGQLEAIDVRNVAIQTFPVYYPDTWADYVECLIADTGRDANFVFRPMDLMTDHTKVLLEFHSFPLYTFVQVNTQFQTAGTGFDYAFNISESDQHPKGLRLFINDVEYTSAKGGPWNPLGTPPDPAPNLEIDESIDITDIIRAGGLDQEYRIRFRATFDPFGDSNRVPGYTSPTLAGVGSSGVIQCSVRVLGTAQAILPEISS